MGKVKGFPCTKQLKMSYLPKSLGPIV